MSADRYVIVYRDGYVGKPHDRAYSDGILAEFGNVCAFEEGPAYRIRIREKPRGLFNNLTASQKAAALAYCGPDTV